MMKYERLMERTANNGVKYDRNDFTRTCYPQNEYAHDDVDRMAIRLAELEDKIEQGTLIELPCKVGDTVYCVGSKCLSGLYDKKCIGHLKDECPCILDEELIVFEKIVQKSLLIHLAFEDNNNFLFGESVFLTREEAEKRLKELQE